ncbi:MAG: hypothetical protein ACJ72W_22640 [Actinoallomurus sp.]
MSVLAYDATQKHRTSTGRNSSGPATIQLRRGAWWLHPGWTGILIVLPCLAITCLIPGNDFRLWWRTPKYFGTADALLTALLLGIFVVGTMVPNLTRRRTQARSPQLIVTAAQRRVLLMAGRVFLGLTLVGYVSWMVAALSRGFGKQQLLGALSLEQGALLSARGEYLTTVPGLTTLTQFGPLALILLLLDRRINDRRHTLWLTVLATFSLARVFLNAERLALMEMAVPIVVLCAAMQPKHHRKQRTWLWAMIPLFAPAAVTTIFGVFEYTRSWNDFYARHSHIGFGTFVLRRLGGYYATASNNSAILLHHYAPSAPMNFTLPFVSDAPILRWSFRHIHSGVVSRPDGWSALLMRYGNLEFVNDGGILPTITDFGLAGALAWWGAIGLLIGICYRSMRSGEIRGLIVYAVTYLGLLEMGLVFYWGLGRAFPVIVGGFVTWLLLHRARAGEE